MCLFNLLYSKHDLYLRYVSNHHFEVKMFEQLDRLIMLDEHINVEEIAGRKTKMGKIDFRIEYFTSSKTRLRSTTSTLVRS